MQINLDLKVNRFPYQKHLTFPLTQLFNVLWSFFTISRTSQRTPDVIVHNKQVSRGLSAHLLSTTISLNHIKYSSWNDLFDVCQSHLLVMSFIKWFISCMPFTNVLWKFSQNFWKLYFNLLFIQSHKISSKLLLLCHSLSYKKYIVWTISNEIWFQGIFYYMSQAIQEQLC